MLHADGRANEEHGSGGCGWSEEHTWNWRQEVNDKVGEKLKQFSPFFSLS